MTPPDAARAASRSLWWLAAALLGLALAWHLADVLLLAFAGVLLAVALTTLMRPLERRLGWSPRWALMAVVLGVTLLLVAIVWVAGASMADQFQMLRETLPKALDASRAWLAERPSGRWLLELWASARIAPEDMARLAGVATGTLNATVGGAGAAALAIAIGVYLAAEPQTYRRGLLNLLPRAARPKAVEVLDASGHELSRWLMGQAVAMVAVGLMTAAGLALIGMPLVFSLSVIAGLLEFIPYFGPIISGLLIVAVALTENQTQALWALLVCVAIQQGEGYVLQPVVQRWAVRLAPVMALLAVLIFGVLFGLPGVLLAVPLMVLTMTLVDRLWSARHADSASDTDPDTAAPTPAALRAAATPATPAVTPRQRKVTR